MVKNITILGGGVSGLAAAYELLKRGHTVKVIEKSRQVGGLAKTIEWCGRPIDMGPHIYHTPDSDIQQYWESEFPGLFHLREHWAKNLKTVLYDYPISREFINTLPEELREKINSDLQNIDAGELARARNYSEYTRALAGETLQKLFFTVYPQKLWGMPTEQLDANWAPKRVQITDDRRAFYQGQWSAVGNEGSGTIIESLAAKVRDLGGEISLDESIVSVDRRENSIREIITSKRKIDISPDDVVINTTSCTRFSELIGESTDLKYRGVILVLLRISRADILPNGVDFIYIDDPEIHFNRVSDQNSFVKFPTPDHTIMCCEITYSVGDEYDKVSEVNLINEVVSQFDKLGLASPEEITDTKLIKLPEVYPMYFLGYREALNITKEKFDSITNLYTIGSLAEFAYADLQILFSKAIDLAEVISSRTFEVNRIDKTIPRLNFNREVVIADKKIGPGNRPFVIAEIGLNHNGDMKLAKNLIDQAIESGADAVKLQSFKAAFRVAPQGKTSRYAEKVLGTEETDYEMLKKNELSKGQTKELLSMPRAVRLYSLPFDLESADELSDLGVDCYKIASFDLVNLPLIRKVAKTGKPMIISTGMAYLSEVEDALLEVAKCGNKNVILMQCTSSYPCPPESMNIRAIDTMRSAFGGLPVGLSDHVVGDAVAIAAVARGADIVEKHFTLDKEMEGPDHVLSLLPAELREMVDRFDIVTTALGDGVKQPAANEVASIIRFRKTMYAAREIAVGEEISAQDVYYTGPAYGIYAKFEGLVVGARTSKAIAKGSPITWDALDLVGGGA